MKLTSLNTAVLGKTLCLFYLGLLSIVLLVPLPKTEESDFINLSIRTSADFDFLTHLFSLFLWGYLLTFWRFNSATELVISIAVAVMLELAQGFTIHRVLEVNDLVANLVGSTLGLKAGLHCRLKYDYRSTGLPSDHTETYDK